MVGWIIRDGSLIKQQISATVVFGSSLRPVLHLYMKEAFKVSHSKYG